MTIITTLELASKMKMRAETESGTFFVSTLFELPTIIHTLFPTLLIFYKYLFPTTFHTLFPTLLKQTVILFSFSKSGAKK